DGRWSPRGDQGFCAASRSTCSLIDSLRITSASSGITSHAIFSMISRLSLAMASYSGPRAANALSAAAATFCAVRATASATTGEGGGMAGGGGGGGGGGATGEGVGMAGGGGPSGSSPPGAVLARSGAITTGGAAFGGEGGGSGGASGD